MTTTQQATSQSTTPPAHLVEISLDGRTVWVHSGVDGSTVGRFSFAFGMDVHRTAEEQISGLGQCLSCTHGPSSFEDWVVFCDLMAQHHGIEIDPSILNG